MIVLQIIIAILCAYGLFCVLASHFNIPSFAVAKATHALGKKRNKKTSKIEIWCRNLATVIEKKLRLSDYKKAQLKADLATADMNMTPEAYVATAIVKALMIGIFAVPLWFVSPIISIMVLVVAVVMYYSHSKKVSNIIKEKRYKIESELPRFVLNIEKMLKHTRDVLYILDNYRESAGTELKRELEITVADMRSGNYEIAITRLESRVGSTMLSDVTRGLIGIIRGDETAIYWATLGIKFSDYQRQLLKRQANSIPKKERRLSMVLLVCFLVMYVVVIGSTLLSSLGGIF